MIKRITNLTRKSFHMYSGPESGEEFKTKNIVFGYNGRGKSSLALGIINEFQKQNTDSYRLFNRKYVTDNLVLEDSDNKKIKGVVANFGKESIDVKKEVARLTDLIVDLTPIKDEISNLDAIVRKEIESIHVRRKGGEEIKRKYLGKNVKDVIKFYVDDISKAKKFEESDDELLKVNGDSELENKKRSIDTFSIPEIHGINSNIADVISKCSDKYDDDLIPSHEVVSWLNDGIHLHKEGDKCKFCDGELKLDDIQSKINLYNENKKQKSVIFLKSFLTELSDALKQCAGVLGIQEGFYSIIDNSEKTIELFESLSTEYKYLSDVKDKISKKIADMGVNITLDSVKLETSISNIVSIYKDIHNIKIEKSNYLQEKISNQSILVKGAIGLEISQNSFITDALEKLSELEKTLNDSIRLNSENEGKIDELKRSKLPTKDFADHISTILADVGITLRLEVMDDYYLIKQISSTNELSIDDISEGEQNLLALLFFYYELFEDKDQTKFKNEIKLIVIDDPISSIDDVNKVFVTELIKNILTLKDVQVFVFTHVWEDFSNLAYGNDANDKWGFFEVKKKDNKSFVVKTLTNETPYRHHFKEIYELSKKSDTSDLSDCEIYHYPNVMRKVLEEFLSFKINNSSPTKTNIGNVSRVLCGKEASNTMKTKLSLLLDICNILSHRASRHQDEILQSAKFLMNRIKAIDEVHYFSMIEERQ